MLPIHTADPGATHTTPSIISPSWASLKRTFDCIVDGIYRSIEKAHLNLEPGYIKINSGELDG